MGDHAVVHFEIGGPDRQALIDFYGKLFGWTINADNPMDYAMVLKMDNGIGGGIMTPPDSSSYASVYVTCGDDVDGVFEKAKSMGATEIMPPMDPGPPAPRLAMFSDPDGNIIGLVSGTPDEVAPMTGDGAPVAWFEIMGGDADKTQAWYRDLFGWTINADNPMKYGETQAIGNGIGGGIGGGMGPNRVTVYASVPNLEDTVAKAKELGATVQMEPTQVPGGPTIAMFADPAGNTTGLLLEGTYGNR